MSDTKIVSNNRPRDVLHWWDLTAKERAEFDYLDTDDKRDCATFFRYRKSVYDLGEFERVEAGCGGSSGNGAFHGWHGFRADSYFSAILIKYCSDFEQVIVGLAYS